MLADNSKRLNEAVSLVKRALEIEADNPSYLDSLGWAYFKQGQADRRANRSNAPPPRCRRTP